MTFYFDGFLLTHGILLGSASRRGSWWFWETRNGASREKSRRRRKSPEEYDLSPELRLCDFFLTWIFWIFSAYSGRRGYRLFIQAYQLILWKQCYVLVHEKGFPVDLEVIFLLPIFSTGSTNGYKESGERPLGVTATVAGRQVRRVARRSR